MAAEAARQVILRPQSSFENFSILVSQFAMALARRDKREGKKTSGQEKETENEKCK
jgi:hypothetical protein